jgi:hypothetical protein
MGMDGYYCIFAIPDALVPLFKMMSPYSERIPEAALEYVTDEDMELYLAKVEMYEDEYHHSGHTTFVRYYDTMNHSIYNYDTRSIEWGDYHRVIEETLDIVYTSVNTFSSEVEHGFSDHITFESRLWT